jgi:hypothetical protein
MAKIDSMESDIHRYEDIMDSVELGSDSEVMQFLQQLRTSKVKQAVTSELNHRPVVAGLDNHKSRLVRLDGIKF